MTSKRSIMIFWALILVPTLIMAIAAVRLLSHEQDRISLSARNSLSQRAKTISETIHFTVEAVQENLTRSLMALDPESLAETLIQWEEINPLVRNVFIYKKEDILEYPVKGMASTAEERRFISRYDPFFSGRQKFDFNNHISRVESQKKNVTESYPVSDRNETLPERPVESSRQKLLALSKVAQKKPVFHQDVIHSGEFKQRIIQKSGWIPWFSENRLYILGWVQKYENGPVYGVELELMTLLSRLIADFPKLSQKNAALVLMDGNDHFMHQSGSLIPDVKQKPVDVIFISSLLPHWRIMVFMDDNGFGKTRGFLYISLMILGIFIAAIVSGGILLIRITLQNMKDAGQKTSFVSSVSHELKTPLTSIRMYAELLLSERIKDEQKTKNYLSIIVNESGRLTRLINNVLDFGKLEQGKKTYHYVDFEMDRFLYEMIETQSIRIKNQGLEIKIMIEKGDYHVYTDRDAMEQVLLNLLDNALKYADKGTFIKLILKRSDSHILLKVCDDGPGIPKAQQKKIFEKFHRADNSLTSKQPGSGLGLSIARQLLRDLGGDLFFESMSKSGSCFTIRINHHDSN